MTNQIIYERIYDAIRERSLPPGAKLSEDKLAGVFHVSRTRIREVLCQLANEKIVTLVANRGAFVTRPSVEQTRAVFEARRIIEPGLVRHLAEHADAADIARLRSHAAEEHAARRGGERKASVRLSGDFHVLLAEVARNEFLHDQMRALVSLTSLIIHLYDSPQSYACLDDEHDRLIDAVEQRDPARAEAEMRTHIDHIEAGLDLDLSKDQEIDLERIFA